jgi:anion-transporting  ArsA/GET3 family ATPase
VKEHQGLFDRILKEANRQIDLAASMPGAEEMALFDRIGGLIRGEDDRFDHRVRHRTYRPHLG